MSFSLVKAVKSTHRHPLNRTFHLIGLSFYVFALFTLIGDHNQNPMMSLALWLTAINLFIAGHTIENNVRAMTAIVIFKCVRSRLSKYGFNRQTVLVSNQ